MPDDIPIPPSRRFSPAPPPSYRPARAAHGLDRTTRTLLIAAGGVVALLLLLVGGWAISGRHGGNGPVPTVQADKQPWRVKPDNPGGMQVIGANEGGGDVPGQPGKTAPVPETPAPEALRAAQVKSEGGQAAPATPTPTASPPANASPPSAPDRAAPPSAPGTPAPTPEATGPAARTPTPPSSPATTTGTFVQLAALDSEAGARSEWQRLKGRMADVLADRQPVVQRAERDGHAVWRLRLGGFPSIADATRFCERVRAKGGACELATF